MSGIARSRHQLSTLLREAYENREALEEKIAEGRRNRKEAGNKYGMYLCDIIIRTSPHLDFRFLIIRLVLHTCLCQSTFTRPVIPTTPPSSTHHSLATDSLVQTPLMVKFR